MDASAWAGVAGGAIGLLGAAAAWWQARSAGKSVVEARRQSAAAEEQATAARESAAEARRQADLAEAALAEATKQTLEAARQAAAAEQQTAAAMESVRETRRQADAAEATLRRSEEYVSLVVDDVSPYATQFTIGNEGNVAAEGVWLRLTNALNDVWKDDRVTIPPGKSSPPFTASAHQRQG